MSTSVYLIGMSNAADEECIVAALKLLLAGDACVPYPKACNGADAEDVEVWTRNLLIRYESEENEGKRSPTVLKQWALNAIQNPGLLDCGFLQGLLYPRGMDETSESDSCRLASEERVRQIAELVPSDILMNTYAQLMPGVPGDYRQDPRYYKPDLDDLGVSKRSFCIIQSEIRFRMFDDASLNLSFQPGYPVSPVP